MSLHCLKCAFVFETADAVKDDVAGPAVLNRCPECMSDAVEPYTAEMREEEDALAYIAEIALCRRKRSDRRAPQPMRMTA